MLTLLLTSVLGLSGCFKGRPGTGGSPNPPVSVSQDDPRVVQMLAELQRVGDQGIAASIQTPLPESVELRIQSLPDGTNANLYYLHEGTARIMHFCRMRDGYRWHGELLLICSGNTTNLADLLCTLPEVRRAMAKWEERDHRPRPPMSRNRGVNTIQSASITLTQTNGR